ncbi:YfcE family phosphodiesterase [Halobacteriales archaeon QS_4_62_28]|nr:MAG: YfcE family phosphodiesterase [Halobacteriales archaeon QS_4_62_28]
MLTIISDTHGTDGHRLTGRTLDAVRDADTVLHAGDFTTTAVYDAIDAEAAELVGVRGNNDEPALAERLPAVATVEWHGYRFVVVHGHERSPTALSILARQETADVVVVGHSHRPEISDSSELLLVNPGSYADPRQFRPAHAEVVDTGEGLRLTLYQPGGKLVTEVCQ